MSLIAGLSKYGIHAVAGFLVGLVAIAVIQPNTLNGKVLLMITAICLTVVVVTAVRALLSAISGRGTRSNGKVGEDS